jgi:hypothetical protein
MRLGKERSCGMYFEYIINNIWIESVASEMCKRRGGSPVNITRFKPQIMYAKYHLILSFKILEFQNHATCPMGSIFSLSARVCHTTNMVSVPSG